MSEYDDGFAVFFEEIKQHPQYNIDKIKQAYELADKAHNGQKRRSGEPYIMHPVAVAKILFELGMDNECIIGALLHDVVEDTEYTLSYIGENFGADVELLVDGVTKLGQIPLSTREEVQAENIRKMFMAMNKDVRVIIIKLADRLHNMRTLQHMPEYKQREKSLETLEIYAPIAHRLGIRAIKEELEDAAVRYLDPIAYREIENSLSMKQEEGENFLNDIKAQISERITPLMENANITSRVKSVHGIFRKVYIKGKSFEEIYDIYAVRIIVNSMIDCYNALGIVHDMFKPLPGRFKDYISTPKPNMYQSLHTTVLSQSGVPFEIQIRIRGGTGNRKEERGKCTERQSLVLLHTGNISLEKAVGTVLMQVLRGFTVCLKQARSQLLPKIWLQISRVICLLKRFTFLRLREMLKVCQPAQP